MFINRLKLKLFGDSPSVFVCLFLLLIPAACVAEEKQDMMHIYRKLNAETTLMLSEARDGFSVGDVKFKAKPCNAGMENVCIEFGDSVFTLPKGKEENINYGDVKISLSDFGKRKVFGKEYNLITVISEKNGYKTTFLYSEKAGLLLISFQEGGQAGVYILQGECGYKALGCIGVDTDKSYHYDDR